MPVVRIEMDKKKPPPAGGGLANPNVVSYEDMIIAQYLEEIKKSPPYTKRS